MPSSSTVPEVSGGAGSGFGSGAPRRKSAARRRAEIADAAVALAREEGLDAVTLRALAARVGVALGLIAHYATSMDDLVAETFAAVVSAELAEVVAFLPDAPAPERIGALMRTALDPARTDVTLVWVQAWALGARNAPLAARVREAMDDWRAVIAAEIVRGMEEGTIPPADPEPIAWHVLAMIDGLGAHALVGWGPGIDAVTPVLRAVAGLLGVAPASLHGRSPAA